MSFLRKVTKRVEGPCRGWAMLCLLTGSVGMGEELKLVKKIPHSGYSEGLDYHDGYLWNSIPKSINKIDPKDGSVVARFAPASEYSESLVWFLGSLWNVSFSNNGIFRGTLESTKGTNFVRVGDTPEVHAWGLEHTDSELVMTGDYSNKLYFYNPKTLKLVRTLVTTAKDIEDLAWDGKRFWSSSFTEHRGHIFTIDPKTGKMGKPISLPNPQECPIIDGTAWDGKTLWVTGKECPSIYQFKIGDGGKP